MIYTKEKRIAVVRGDGIGPEMIDVTWPILVETARRYDKIRLIPIDVAMGWAAYPKYGDTLPQKSLETALEIGYILFSGVGNPEFDKKYYQYLEMTPEKRVLLGLRGKMGLLINSRPVIFYKELVHLSKLKMLPQDITQFWFRFLLQDVYFGNDDLIHLVPEEIREKIGLKLKQDVTGKEKIVSNLAYFSLEYLEKYFRAVFSYAREMKLPLIVIDKSNITALDTYWRLVAKEIGKEFPDVPVSFQYVDSAAMLVVTNPEMLNAVIACQNMQGDIMTDLANAPLSVGLMHSSAINPDTGMAMFERGSGTAPTLAGKDIANPLGMFLTEALMLRHIGGSKGADAIEQAVRKVLQDGWRTADLFREGVDDPAKLLGTKGMGAKVQEYLNKEEV
ncbi:MAG: isocitrate/isopropylmalate family dehydrogenase [bacterium]|nr:isocitrate/isopropylmalate family dehydrogenase [bacterium]